MTIIQATGITVAKYPYSHDSNESKYYTFCYRPKVRANSTEYLLDDVVIPATASGLYHICTNPGISAGVAPTFATASKGVTVDGTVKWKAVPYDLLLLTGDVITSSTWTSDTGVTIDNTSFSLGITWCRVTAVPLAATFTLTNSVAITRASGFQEVFDRSIIVNIKEL